MASTESETRRTESGDALRPERGAQSGAEQLLHAVDPSIGERSDADPLDRIQIAQELRQWFDHCVMFRIDVDPEIRPGREEFLEQGDRLPAVDLGLSDLCPVELLDGALTVGDPIQTVVVEREHLPVGGEVCIRLDIAVPELDGAGEGRHRVLRPLTGTSPMGEGDGCGGVEEGMRSLRHMPTVDAA